MWYKGDPPPPQDGKAIFFTSRLPTDDNQLILADMDVKEDCSKCWGCCLQWLVPKRLESNVPQGSGLVFHLEVLVV